MTSHALADARRGVRLEHIEKRFGDVPVIRDVSLEAEAGELVVFVGPSGCGKSTLLRLIAGLETPTAGRLLIGEQEVTTVAPAKRGIAMVFQSYALYPHMSVAENMAFGLRIQGMPRAQIDARVGAAAELLQLTALLDRKPRALSGGQRQRVAIGRAIVREPAVFLFDEPLSNLDAALRGQMRVEIAKLHAQLGVTMIYVTHDQVEAMTLATKIVVLNAGQVEQIGAPLDLYNHPANLFVAGFLGSPRMNFVPGDRLAGAPAGSTLGIRPEDLRLLDPNASGSIQDGVRLSGEVTLVERLGGETLAYVRLDGAVGEETVTAKLDGSAAVSRGKRIVLEANPAKYHLFDAQGVAVRR